MNMIQEERDIGGCRKQRERQSQQAFLFSSFERRQHNATTAPHPRERESARLDSIVDVDIIMLWDVKLLDAAERYPSTSSDVWAPCSSINNPIKRVTRTVKNPTGNKIEWVSLVAFASSSFAYRNASTLSKNANLTMSNSRDCEPVLSSWQKIKRHS